jgi:hypothetical protein
MAFALAVSAEERPAVPVAVIARAIKKKELIHGRARKWPVVVLNVLADRVKRICALALTAHVALSKEPSF